MATGRTISANLTTEMDKKVIEFCGEISTKIQTFISSVEDKKNSIMNLVKLVFQGMLELEEEQVNCKEMLCAQEVLLLKVHFQIEI